MSNNEPDYNDIPRNVRDLDANSKILDFQNKNISSASIGPYPIGANSDPTVTMRSVAQANDTVDKKIKQKQYVKELEEQIKLRDQIRNEEEQRRKKKLDSYQPDLELEMQKAESTPPPNLNGNIPSYQKVQITETHLDGQFSPSKPSSSVDQRRGFGSAPKPMDNDDSGPQKRTDPFGGNIPIRKKIVNRIDQELESRGSIFSGRDEKSILIRKRNIQQQHMREELLRQIEEKKKREEETKKKRMEEEIKEESRIKHELQQLHSEDGADMQNTGMNREYDMNSRKNKRQNPVYKQNSDATSNDGFLPELTNRTSEPLRNVPDVDQDLELKQQSHSAQPNFETTAAFANYDPKNKSGHEEEEENIANLGGGNSFGNANNDSNKIKQMIDQCDNKKSLQDQINKRMDMRSSQGNPVNESPISNGPVVGNPKIGELSDIVKKLLDEQRELKSKLNERDEIIADLSKEKTTKRKNTQERERRTRSLKPQEKASKKVGSADNKSLAARRLREKHTQEKDRINAIEDKIEKARLRKAEKAREMSIKANKVGGLGKPIAKSRPSSDFDPKMYKHRKKNSDLEGLERERSGRDNQFDFLLEYSDPNLKELNVAKTRGIESPNYTISSKIEELNTQSRSKRSNYDNLNSKRTTSQKYVGKYSNIKQDYEDMELDENIQEEQAFMFSLPPDDDDNYSAYSLLGGNMAHRTPMTEFDVAASEGGDQIDLLMNAYNRPNMRSNNMQSIPMSEMTTSMGINYSPNMNEVYVYNKDDNSSGFYQSGNFPSGNYPMHIGGKNDQFYASGVHSNYNYPSGYKKEQYSAHSNMRPGQSRGRQLNSNAIAGQMISGNGKIMMSPGNRVGSNIMYIPPNSHQNTKYRG